MNDLDRLFTAQVAILILMGFLLLCQFVVIAELRKGRQQVRRLWEIFRMLYGLKAGNDNDE